MDNQTLGISIQNTPYKQGKHNVVGEALSQSATLTQVHTMATSHSQILDMAVIKSEVQADQGLWWILSDIEQTQILTYLEILLHELYWANMKCEAKENINKCDVCQCIKISSLGIGETRGGL